MLESARQEHVLKRANETLHRRSSKSAVELGVGCFLGRRLRVLILRK